ncbi:hypothetical protein SEVIR_2G440500v4 [Setaria viridis]|uniref:DUF1618 domain-containing protein n=3 Tax=Setaria TaxID=4554 RepID=K3ZTL4_SETIT|nr:uncharacterized protein LOC101775625 [Setaria italica]XP_034582138.1 uncharacterized protein LOC117845274 isoform X2 [Setaria viridis]XP_034582139.1 uncharacterized protein LOC117845274 isoform X2 [Setaria viridis]XP_034582140.1 uncharacterized protein LOC117845274 isoform X2 [Setaria viridis]XP_034582141.1 uncharacterized protein LOC117845274 isoform X2 [Setaria viridis]RCV14460.1 hypothetical protein SETIT_2G428000v2 [Setaria italica]TKW36442.1 hypothetical protein SEVIR_2G440500v2 [Seta
MSLRRYVNLVMANHDQGIYSLRRLNNDNFFYPAKEAAAKARDLPRLKRVPQNALSSWIDPKKKQAAALTDKQLESTLKPPPPIFSLRPSTCPVTKGDWNRLHSFPLSGTKIFFADSGKRTTLYDTKARCSISTPCLHAPKKLPVALSVPSPEGPEGEQDQDGGSLYIMDTLLDEMNATPFEALIWRNCAGGHYLITHKSWHCDALPRPPFFDHRPDEPTSVQSYAVVGNIICVSVNGHGTYCFDTVSQKWSMAGDWQMPFSGKAEYVPELKLWFGASAGNHQLPCAADLSPILRGHAPKKQQHYVWGDPHVPAEWLPNLFNPAKIVSLGSGRFCIINFFQDMGGRPPSMDGLSASDGSPIVVFSGLEVLAGNGNGSSSSSSSDSDKDSCNDKGNGNGLRMIKHKSRLCVCKLANIHYSLESVL